MDILTGVFAHAVALSALAVVATHQILKTKIIPIQLANRFPVPTVILLSLAAAVIVNLKTGVHPKNTSDWLILTSTITVTAALTYLTTIKNWEELRALEG